MCRRNRKSNIELKKRNGENFQSIIYRENQATRYDQTGKSARKSGMIIGKTKRMDAQALSAQ